MVRPCRLDRSRSIKSTIESCAVRCGELTTLGNGVGADSVRPSNRVIEMGKVGKARNALEALGEALDFSKRMRLAKLLTSSVTLLKAVTSEFQPRSILMTWSVKHAATCQLWVIALPNE